MDYLPSLFCILVTIGAISAALQPGKFSHTLSQDSRYAGFVKTLFKNSTVKLKVRNIDCEGSIQISWLLRSSSCYGEYKAIAGKADPWKTLRLLCINPQASHDDGVGSYLWSIPEEIQCHGEHTFHVFKDYSDFPWTIYPKVNQIFADTTSHDSALSVAADDGHRQKRADDVTDDKVDIDSKTGNRNHSVGDSVTNLDKAKVPVKSKVSKTEKFIIARIPQTAPYILVVNVASDDDQMFSVDLESEMETPLGYLSAHDYPLKTFYMIMCIVYSLYAVAWLVVSACNFRDLLRVQFWIGGVILLGMIEKVLFYLEYWSLNRSGVSVVAVVVISEFVSTLKRTLARMLLIVTSYGFGIVKRHHALKLHRVVRIGMIYFIFSVVEALIRNFSLSHHSGSVYQIIAGIPLVVVDFIVFCWMVRGLMQTTKILWLRQGNNYNLFRYFSNTISFCVIASFALILFSARHLDSCEAAWQKAWIDEAFWHILFSILLLVIIILWRPNVNKQKYAFSPLLDAEGGAEELLQGQEKLFDHSAFSYKENSMIDIDVMVSENISDQQEPVNSVNLISPTESK